MAFLTHEMCYKNVMYCFVCYIRTGTKSDVSWECSEGWRVPVWGLQAMTTVYNYLLQANVFLTWEKSTLLTYAWAWQKTNLLSIRGPGGFSLSDCGGPMDNDSTSYFMCDKMCHQSTESFLRSFICLKKKQKTPYWQPHRCKLWPKMAQELKPTSWVERTK